MVNLRYLHRLLSPRPPRLHHRRELLTSGCTHRLPTSGFLRGRRNLLGLRLALLLCPPCLLCSTDSGPSCRTHATTFLGARWSTLAPLGWTAATCGLGTEAHKSCNCTFDTTSFLPESCYYALNVHVVLSLLAISTPVVQPVNGITAFSVHPGFAGWSRATLTGDLASRCPLVLNSLDGCSQADESNSCATDCADIHLR